MKQWSLLLLIIFSGGLSEVAGQEVDTPMVNYFDTALVQFAQSAPLKHASWGFMAVDVVTGEQYRAVNEHLSLVPASTLKPFTSAPALSLLGNDYRFKTDFTISGSIDSSGMLDGNLYIRGGGDPTLGSDRFGVEASVDSLFDRVLNALRYCGIQSISGAVVGDASGFETMTVIPSWQYEDVGNHYGAVASGLNIYDNIVAFLFEPGKREGDTVKLVGTRPFVPYLEIVEEVITGPRRSGDRVNVYGAPHSHLRWLRGTVPAGTKGYEVSGTLPDPAYHAAFALHEFLVSNGIEILNQPTTQLRMTWQGECDTLSRQTIYLHLSPPLSEVVYYINFRSVNMYAEALLRTLGKERYGEGTTQAGLKAVLWFWQQRGVDLSGLNLKDGSGLSRKNNITPKALATSLAVYTTDPQWPLFYASFPVAGETGGVASYFRKSVAKGNLRAKSGTLEKVKSYSGYATTAGGQKLAWSLMVNNYSGSHSDLMKEIESLLIKMCEIE